MKKNVLVADDNRVMVDVLRFNLDQVGLDTTIARNGREAWNVLQRGGIDLLITDYQMPLMNGEELCRNIRHDERLAGLPIILLSAKGFELDIERTQAELGLRAILFKPFSPQQLVELVMTCLEPQPEATPVPA